MHWVLEISEMLSSYSSFSRRKFQYFFFSCNFKNHCSIVGIYWRMTTIMSNNIHTYIHTYIHHITSHHITSHHIPCCCHCCHSCCCYTHTIVVVLVAHDGGHSSIYPYSLWIKHNALHLHHVLGLSKNVKAEQ